MKKISRGTADAYHNIYNLEKFKEDDHNEVFDDSILRYRAARNVFWTPGRQINYQRLYTALLQNLSPTMTKNAPQENFTNRIENFLICRKLSEYMAETVLDESAGKFFEETALKAIYRSFFSNIPLSDMRLLFAELPNILTRNYPVVNDIRQACIKIIPQILNLFRVYDANAWKEFVDLKSLMLMLQTFDGYEQKK